MCSSVIVGIIGSNGVGKELFAQYLIEKKDFKRFTFSIDKVGKDGIEYNEGCFDSVEKQGRKYKGKNYINITCNKIKNHSGHAVVTNIRTVEELSAIEKLGAFIVFIVKHDLLCANGEDKIPDLCLKFNDLKYNFLYFRNLYDDMISAWHQFETFYEELIESECVEEGTDSSMDDDNSNDNEELSSDE
jgi:hypothetical protein